MVDKTLIIIIVTCRTSFFKFLLIKCVLSIAFKKRKCLDLLIIKVRIFFLLLLCFF